MSFLSIPRPANPAKEKERLRVQNERVQWDVIARPTAVLLAAAAGILLYAAMLYTTVCTVSSIDAISHRQRFQELQSWSREYNITLASIDTPTWAKRRFRSAGRRGFLTKLPIGIETVPMLLSITIPSATDQQLGVLLDFGYEQINEVTILEGRLTAESFGRLAAIPELKILTLDSIDIPKNAFTSPQWEGRQVRQMEFLSCTFSQSDMPGPSSPVIRRLKVQNCQVDPQELAWVGSQVRLEYLLLAGEEVTDDVLLHLNSRSNLQELYLENTAVTGRSFRHLDKLTGLRVISCLPLQTTNENQPVAQTIPYQPAAVAIPPLPRLYFLHLPTIPLDDIALKSLADCEQLTDLDVLIPHATDDGLVALGAAGELTSITLRQVQVTGSGFSFLNFLKPSRLRLIDSTLTPQVITAIASTKPKIEVKEVPLWNDDYAVMNSPLFEIIGSSKPAPKPDEPPPPPPDYYHLQDLDISGGLLTAPAMAALSGIAVHRHLTLSNTGLTDDALATFSPPLWPETIDLTGNPVTPDGIVALVKRQIAADPDTTTSITCKSLTRDQRLALSMLLNELSYSE